MNEMCSVCIVRAQRDDDEFLPCSPACFRAVFNNLDQLLKEYWLDAARDAVAGLSEQWVCQDTVRDALAAIDELREERK